MTMQLEVDGIPYTFWENASLTRSMETIAGAFSFQAVVSEVSGFPIRRGAPVRVLVNGVPCLTGFIDRLEIGGTPEDHRLTVQGRDRTADIVDSTLPGGFTIAGGSTLEAIITKVLNYLNYDGRVINLVPGLKAFSANEVAVAAIGDGAFAFLEKYARKRQVLLTTDGLGNIVIARASDSVVPVVLLNRYGQPGNNIEESSVSYDETGVFSSYRVWSQANPAAAATGGETQPAKATVNISGKSTDTSVRSSRIMNVRPKGSLSASECTERAAWEQAARRARSFNYSVTVSGFGHGGGVWVPNRLVMVDDDFTDVRACLRIKDLTFALDGNGGSTTKLSLVDRAAFDLSMQETAFNEKPVAKKKAAGTKTDKPLVW